MSHVYLKGKEVAIIGSFLGVGDLAPNFSLVTQSLETVTIDAYKGKIKIIVTVPSLDTPVCAKEGGDFNGIAIAHPDIVIIIVSKDLPFAQARYCLQGHFTNIVTLSDMRPKSTFGKDYGVLIGSGPLEGILARSIIMLDNHDKVIYSELVSEITNPPNFDFVDKLL